MISPEKKQLLVAALLHDIGKFWQRADTWLGPDCAIKDTRTDFLKSLVPFNNNGKPTHQHALWTYQFLEDKAATFQQLGIWNTDLGKLSELAARHHQPGSEAECIIQLADHYSAGIDRQEKDQAEQKQDWGKYAFKSVALRSPFGRLTINNKKVDDAHFVPFVPLAINKTAVRPIDKDGFSGAENQALAQKAYREMWHAFSADFDRMPANEFDDFYYSLNHLLKKYCWCIPSDTTGAPIVNLYEHLKTTAGICAGLFDYLQESGLTVAAYQAAVKAGNAGDALLMVCLDLSGIQAFIYDISSKKAYKSLKGRSFFLQALITQMSNTILRETKQAISSVLYESGGKAFLILPNTEEVAAGLIEAMAKLEDQAFYEEGGKIYPALGSVPFHFSTQKSEQPVRSTEFPTGKGDLGRLWRSVSEAAAAAKSRRYQRLLTQNFNEFFSEDSVTAKNSESNNLCAVSGEPIVGEGELLDRNAADGNALYVNARVNDQITLGRNLKDSEFALTTPLNGKGIGFKHLASALKLVPAGKDYQARDGEKRTRFNDTDFLPSDAISGGYGFAFYGGNRQPDGQGGEPATLEDLCRVGVKDDFSLLGVLRMDVDGLGDVFIKGLPEVDKTFAAYATLSAHLDHFFSGYLNTIRNKAEFKDQVAILYAGGDDVFAVGRWDKLLHFAIRVRADFTRFVGRTDLSISAGFTIVQPKFPIYRAADLAGEAEHQAKSHYYQGQKKNAISLFGVPFNWELEFPTVQEMKKVFVCLIQHHGLSRAILHRLRENYAKSLPDPKTGKIDLSYKWQLAYSITRLTERNKDEKVKSFLQSLNKDLLHHAEGADHYLILAAAAARWAEYELNTHE
jgi:CRISPR-associated protein Csm1